MVKNWMRFLTVLKRNQIYLCPIGIAAAIGLMADDSSPARFFFVFGALAAILVLLLLAFQRWSDHRRDRAAEKRRGLLDTEDLLDQSRMLTSEEAASQFEQLAPEVGVRFKASETPFATEYQLPPMVQELFSRYESIEFRASTSLARRYVQYSEFRPGYIVLGYSDEHVDIIVRPNEETIYELTLDDPELGFEEMVGADYPSVYHWLLFNARLRHERVMAEDFL